MTDEKIDGHDQNVKVIQIARKEKQKDADKFALEILIRPLTDPDGCLCDAAELDLKKQFKRKPN